MLIVSSISQFPRRGVNVDQVTDFRMLAKATDAGKQLDPGEVRHLMALFGTFPPDVESEP